MCTDALCSGATIPHLVRGTSDGTQWRLLMDPQADVAKLTKQALSVAEDVQMAGRCARMSRQRGTWYKHPSVQTTTSDIVVKLKAMTCLIARNLQLYRKDGTYEDLDHYIDRTDPETFTCAAAAEANDMDVYSFRKVLSLCEDNKVPMHFKQKPPGRQYGTHDEWNKLVLQDIGLSFDPKCPACNKFRDDNRACMDERENERIQSAVLNVCLLTALSSLILFRIRS